MPYLYEFVIFHHHYILCLVRLKNGSIFYSLIYFSLSVDYFLFNLWMIVAWQFPLFCVCAHFWLFITTICHTLMPQWGISGGTLIGTFKKIINKYNNLFLKFSKQFIMNFAMTWRHLNVFASVQNKLDLRSSARHINSKVKLRLRSIKTTSWYFNFPPLDFLRSIHFSRIRSNSN